MDHPQIGTVLVDEPAVSTADPLNIDPGLRRHIPALDGVRGIAILLVMFYHMTVMNSYTTANVVFQKIANFGWCGVDLFFVLSGFLITGILYQAKNETHYFRNFYARRTLRVFPLYYAVVILSLVVIPFIAPSDKLMHFGRIKGQEIYYWLYLQDFVIALRTDGPWKHGILDVTWSLAIEEHFYLIWPAIVLYFNRRTVMQICGALFAVAVVCRIALYFGNAPEAAEYVLTPCRMDGLAAGAWLALVMAEPTQVTRYLTWAKRAAVFALILLVGIIAFERDALWSTPPMRMIGYSLLAVICTAFLILALNAPVKSRLGKIVNRRELRVLGKYSYALYMFHLPLRAVVRDKFFGPAQFDRYFHSQLLGQLLFYPVALGLSLAVAWCSWNLFEKHFLKLKRLFPV